MHVLGRGMHHAVFKLLCLPPASCGRTSVGFAVKLLQSRMTSLAFSKSAVAERHAVQLGDARGKLGAAVWGLFTACAWAFPRMPAAARGGLGNTALVYHHRRLLALMEAGFSFLLRACAGMVESVGTYVWGGQLTHAVTAHPKLDPETGEMHTICHQCAPWPLPRVSVCETCILCIQAGSTSDHVCAGMWRLHSTLS